MPKRRANQCFLRIFLLLLFGAFLSSCAKQPGQPSLAESTVYAALEAEDLLARFAPAFVAGGTAEEFNRIGRVEAAPADPDGVEVRPDTPVVYTSRRHFATDRGDYTNLLYRIHFSRVPFSIVPFYLGAGENVGLLVVVTLDGENRPLLYTLVHTCGCYLAFIPTSHLAESSWPEGWRRGRQVVYGEDLPSFLDFEAAGGMVVVQLRPATHRVGNVWLADPGELARYRVLSPVFKPFAALEELPLPDGSTTSFFEESGARRGYVKGSQKIWERLLMSWWALDWRVGEDKKLGEDLEDGIVFYTSLKPWARKASDMRNFARFLDYWGWRL